MHPMTRRQFLRSMAIGLGLPVVGFTYARFLEPRWLKVSHHHLKLPGLNVSQPIKLLHLSDLHYSSWVPLDLIRFAFEKGLQEKPDLICLTGDYYNRRIINRGIFEEVFRLLSAAAPTFAIPGNHDGGSWVKRLGGYPDISALKDFFTTTNIKLLQNQSEDLSFQGQPLRLIGLGDWWAGSFKPQKAFAPEFSTSKVPTIVLSHNPDTKAFLHKFRWDLMLCGHTHGGQLQIPFIGAPFAPISDKRYLEGLKPWKDRLIHITRGIGSLWGMRINCRPEISILHIS